MRFQAAGSSLQHTGKTLCRGTSKLAFLAGPVGRHLLHGVLLEGSPIQHITRTLANQ